MNHATILRYQPGGDIYHTLSTRYGEAAANAIAEAALTGDRAQLGSAIATAKGDGPPLDDSTLGVLESYSPSDWINNATDYYVEGANKIVKHSLLDLLTHPLVLI